MGGFAGVPVGLPLAVFGFIVMRNPMGLALISTVKKFFSAGEWSDVGGLETAHAIATSRIPSWLLSGGCRGRKMHREWLRLRPRLSPVVTRWR
jgi:hypothetical protein